MKPKKKVGIVVDNYKISKYVEELTGKGFTVGALSPLNNQTTSIALNVEENQVEEISKLCSVLEHQFKSN